MKYFEVNFTIEPFTEDFADVLSACLADIGFETFETTPIGLRAYIQQSLLKKSSLEDATKSYPIEGVNINYQIQEAPDEDWNSQWEQEGFQPIIIGEDICIHDIHHTNVPSTRFDIQIHPQQAFGTGSHETTRLILKELLDTPLKGKNIVDAGTGTGILGILAKKIGAETVFAYDIDEWSVRNAQENSKINGIFEGMEIMQGDASLLDHVRDIDLLIANINRNILLQDMPRFRQTLKPQGEILLSGFYQKDVSLLQEKAKEVGMTLKRQRTDGEWTMLLFKTDTGSRMNS